MSVLKNLLFCALLILLIFIVVFLLLYPSDSILTLPGKDYVIKCAVLAVGISALMALPCCLYDDEAVIPSCVLMILYITLTLIFYWESPLHLLTCVLFLPILIYLVVVGSRDFITKFIRLKR